MPTFVHILYLYKPFLILFLKVFSLDLLSSLPFGSKMRKILSCNPLFLIQVEKKKKQQQQWKPIIQNDNKSPDHNGVEF